MTPKILIIPARRHIIEAYTEYLISYLSDEFYFDVGYPPEAEYYDSIAVNVLEKNTSILNKNPNDYDLIYPHFSTHTFLEPESAFQHKLAIVILDSFPRFHGDVAVWGSATEGMSPSQPHHKLRFGIDTKLLRPIPMARTDDKFRVGTLGNVQTPRRYVKELFVEALSSMDKTRLMIYPAEWHKHTRIDEIELMGGMPFLSSVVDGDRQYPSLPNMYNQMDVFVRPDIDQGYHFPVMEAAACGVPVVCCDSGNNKELTDAGGGILIDPSDRDLTRIAREIRGACEYLRDNTHERIKMGIAGRKFIEKNYTWSKWAPKWREFFREGIKNANI